MRAAPLVLCAVRRPMCCGLWVWVCCCEQQGDHKRAGNTHVCGLFSQTRYSRYSYAAVRCGVTLCTDYTAHACTCDGHFTIRSPRTRTHAVRRTSTYDASSGCREMMMLALCRDTVFVCECVVVGHPNNFIGVCAFGPRPVAVAAAHGPQGTHGGVIIPIAPGAMQNRRASLQNLRACAHVYLPYAPNVQSANRHGNAHEMCAARAYVYLCAAHRTMNERRNDDNKISPCLGRVGRREREVTRGHGARANRRHLVNNRNKCFFLGRVCLSVCAAE